MNETKSTVTACSAASSIVLALVLTGVPAAADDDATRAFAATSEVDTASGTVIKRDVLVLQTSAAGTSLRLVDNGAASAPLAVSLASDGELVANSSEPSVTCYNMAVLLENAVQHPSGTPPTLFFALGGNAVPVVMTQRLVRGSDRRDTTLSAGRTGIAITGNPGAGAASVTVTSRVESVGGNVQAASFTEITSVAGSAAAQPVGRTSCSIELIPVPVST